MPQVQTAVFSYEGRLRLTEHFVDHLDCRSVDDLFALFSRPRQLDESAHLALSDEVVPGTRRGDPSTLNLKFPGPFFVVIRCSAFDRVDPSNLSRELSRV